MTARWDLADGGASVMLWQEVRVMTEAEWLVSGDPNLMLKFLGRMPSERKLRLFAAACCRRNWHLLSDEISRPGVEVVERYADGLAPSHELEEVSRTARSQGRSFQKLCDWRRNTRGPSLQATLLYRESQQSYLVAYASRIDDYLWMVVMYTTQCKVLDVVGSLPATDQSAHEVWQRLCDADRADVASLLRNIFGNPFRPVTFSPSWRTSTAIAVAKQMYESRDFSAMPILADALQDAGCDNDDILNHCRDPQATHVRGCWVVDLVLGRE
jgi:hypothetical protein